MRACPGFGNESITLKYLQCYTWLDTSNIHQISTINALLHTSQFTPFLIYFRPSYILITIISSTCTHTRGIVHIVSMSAIKCHHCFISSSSSTLRWWFQIVTNNYSKIIFFSSDLKLSSSFKNHLRVHTLNDHTISKTFHKLFVKTFLKFQTTIRTFLIEICLNTIRNIG